MLALLAALRVVVPLVVLEPAAPAALPSLGRVYTSERVHVGVRPHFFTDGTELAGAVTVQVTMRTPW